MSADPPGTPVPLPAAQRPSATILTGESVHLSHFSPQHAAELYPRITAPSLWRFMPAYPPSDVDSFRARATEMSNSADPFFFAVVDQRQNHSNSDSRTSTTGKAVGYLTLMRIVPEHLCIEIGNVMFSPAMQKSVCSTEAIYLVLQYAFDTLGYRRVEWKCNSRHEGSRRAALRLGFTFEGIFRQHMVIKGVNRDTAWFAMLRDEWDGYVREAMRRWLEEGNFEVGGGQRKRLEDIRDEVKGERGL